MSVRRKTSTVLAGLAALLLAGGVAATSAQAGTHDNNNGVIRYNGVAQPLYTGSGVCPSGSFCMLAHTQYDTFHTWAFPSTCRHYTMDNWNAHGSWVNNSKYLVWFRDGSGAIVGHASPGTSSPDFDFNPVWSFDVC
ncbi:hypothetical protein ACIQBJ_27385 [Kitasatospora sp. NPDC088391]|uniref:hypothetical protein n=1 Tax=Kitasatospora sp. NPDC088391 TaxID=3364074 RepID=UPI003818474B